MSSGTSAEGKPHFLTIIEEALAKKNTQQHRIVGGTKKARQSISANCTTNGNLIPKAAPIKLAGRGS